MAGSSQEDEEYGAALGVITALERTCELEARLRQAIQDTHPLTTTLDWDFHAADQERGALLALSEQLESMEDKLREFRFLTPADQDTKAVVLGQLDTIRRELLQMAQHYAPKVTFAKEVMRDVLAFATVAEEAPGSEDGGAASDSGNTTARLAASERGGAGDEAQGPLRPNRPPRAPGGVAVGGLASKETSAAGTPKRNLHSFLSAPKRHPSIAQGSEAEQEASRAHYSFQPQAVASAEALELGAVKNADGSYLFSDGGNNEAGVARPISVPQPSSIRAAPEAPAPAPRAAAGSLRRGQSGFSTRSRAESLRDEDIYGAVNGARGDASSMRFVSHAARGSGACQDARQDASSGGRGGFSQQEEPSLYGGYGAGGSQQYGGVLHIQDMLSKAEEGLTKVAEAKDARRSPRPPRIFGDAASEGPEDWAEVADPNVWSGARPAEPLRDGTGPSAQASPLRERPAPLAVPAAAPRRRAVIQDRPGAIQRRGVAPERSTSPREQRRGGGFLRAVGRLAVAGAVAAGAVWVKDSHGQAIASAARQVLTLGQSRFQRKPPQPADLPPWVAAANKAKGRSNGKAAAAPAAPVAGPRQTRMSSSKHPRGRSGTAPVTHVADPPVGPHFPGMPPPDVSVAMG